MRMGTEKLGKSRTFNCLGSCRSAAAAANPPRVGRLTYSARLTMNFFISSKVSLSNVQYFALVASPILRPGSSWAEMYA